MSNQETVDADALRETLEARVSKLQKTLQYWQTWEAEYEGLKDELDALEEDPTTEQMYQIGCDYASHVVNEKEVAQLVALGKTPARSRMQVVALLKGRMQSTSTIIPPHRRKLTPLSRKAQCRNCPEANRQS